MSAKVFLIVWGLTEHRGYMVLMIMKQNLLNTKAFDDIEVIHCIMQSRYISKRTRETVGPPDGISYANSHTLHPDFFILGRGALMILTSLGTSYKWHHNSICPLCIKSLRGIHVVTCDRISFIFRVAKCHWVRAAITKYQRLGVF